jgi:hypothetical protein
VTIDRGRVVCDACGVVHAEATETIAMLERKRTALDTRISKLQADQDTKVRNHPKAAAAREVLEEWGRLLAPRAKELLSIERLKPTLARLDGGWTVEELKLCVLGYSRQPYVDSEGHRSSQGTAKQKHIEPDLIFRDAKHVESGLRMADDTAPQQPTVATIAQLPWRKVWAANRHLIVQALTRQFGQGFRPMDSAANHLLWPCPRCVKLGNDAYETKRVSTTDATDEQIAYGRYLGTPLEVHSEVGGPICDCRVCGLSEAPLLEAIGKLA